MDSIDIERAIAQLDVYKKRIALDGEDTDCFDIAFDIMRQYPTDPVDRVTIKEYLEYTCGNGVQYGQWIFADEVHEHARCSNCGYGDVDLFDGKPHNYCENCGRKMEDDKE